MKSLMSVVALGAILPGLIAFGEEPDKLIRCLQHDGTQYFDTGVIGKPYTKCDVEFCVSDTPAHATGQIGCIKGSDKFALLHQHYGWGMHFFGKLINNVPSSEATDRPIRLQVTIEPKYQAVEWNGQTWTASGASTTDPILHPPRSCAGWRSSRRGPAPRP